MNRRFIFNHFVTYDGHYIKTFVAFWLIGICFGIGLSFWNPPVISSGLRFCLLTPRSFSGFLASIAPLFLLVIFLWCDQFLLLCPLMFVSAISWGYTAFLVFSVFGSGSWLVRLLLLFSGSFVSALYWWILLRHGPFRRPSFATDVAVAAVFLFVVFALEQSLISPCLHQIIKYL